MVKPRIGFIGLGLMGSAMVERLQSLDYELTVMANRSRAKVDAAVARGATEAPNAKGVAEASDIVMLCVDTSASVEARIYGADGVLAGIKAGSTVIDFGTSLPASTKKICADMGKADVVYLDAPLGRTPAHAVDGLLNIMCAGDESGYEKVKPVLEDLGENVFHLGKSGNGHTIKLINNFFAQCIAMSMAESFAMADAAGIERQSLYDVVAAGPLHSGMMDFIKAYAIDGDPNQLAFSVRNARKDVGYYIQMANDAGVPSILSPAPKQALNLGLAAGYGDKMVPEMVDFFSELFSGE